MPPSVGLNSHNSTKAYLPPIAVLKIEVSPYPRYRIMVPSYAAYYLLLQARVSHLRISGKTLMGTLLPENRSDHKISDVDNPDRSIWPSVHDKISQKKYPPF